MRRLLAFTLLCALALPCAAQAGPVQTRIVGGTQVAPGDYPWQVAVSTSEGFCGGTLVAARYVLTAEHCQPEPGDFVRAGSYDRTAGGQLLLVEQVVEHPMAFAGGEIGDPAVFYAPRFDANLLRLEAAVTNAKPLTVVDPDDSALWAEGASLRITGWGLQHDSDLVLPHYMREATVPAVSDISCATDYDEFVSADMFCAGFPAGGVDSCGGDSGGPIAAPLVPSPSKADPADWRLVGVTSWGYGCAEANAPGVYARLGAAELGDWVRAVLAAAPAETPDPDPEPRGQDDDVVAAPTGEIIAPPSEEVAPAPVTTPVAATPAVSLAIARRCTRKRRCTFTITPSAKVAKVRASLRSTTKRACRRGGRRTTCAKVTTRTLKTRASTVAFTTPAAALRKGAHTLTVTPLDAAGKRAGTPKRYRFSVR